MAKKLAFDKLLFTAIVVLLGLGLAMVYSASAALAHDQGGGLNSFVVKQSFAAILGMAAMVIAMHLDYRLLRNPVVAYALVVVALVLLVAVLFSPTVNNTRRWFLLGGFSFQPAEFAKLAIVCYLAYQVERKREVGELWSIAVPGLAIAGLMSALIVLQPDLGTAVMVSAAALLMVFLAGLRWRFVFGSVFVLLPLLLLLIVSAPYRRARLLSFLDPAADPLGSGYQAAQSLIAVGSGGLFGLGPGNSLQKLHYLPYPHSDFIFAIIAEELGLLGAVAVIGLFCLLLWRGVRAGWLAPDPLGRFLAWGFTGLIGLQAFMHMGVALSMLPTKGIPLPLISYGGSSLLMSMIACGVLLNVSQHS